MAGSKVKWRLSYILVMLLIQITMFMAPVFQKTSFCLPAESAAVDKTIIHFFGSQDCPTCEEIKPFLEEMKIKYPGIEVKEFQVFKNKENRDLLLKMLDDYEAGFSGFPVIFIEDRMFQSFGETVKMDLEAAIRRSIDEDYLDPMTITSKTVTPINIPLLGKTDAANLPLPLVTILLAVVDSFNPCAFFVLFSLLGLLVQVRSRKKMLLIGSIFVFFSGFLYFLFIAAWLNIFLVFRHIKTITLAAGMVSVLIGVINIKDFFFFKQGISLTIPDGAKPKLFARMRKLLKSTSLPSIVVGTTMLAVAANFYELLCTAGFPMVFTRVLTLNNLPPLMYYMYLMLYTLVYVIPLIAIVIIFTLTLGKRNLSQGQGRALKFVSGVIMLSIGLLLMLGKI